MLKDQASAAIVAVKDLATAKTFYGETLELTLDPASDDHILMFQTGATKLVVYVSEFAGTNKANAVVWGVGDEIETIVAHLRAKGVAFEQYDLPDATYDRGIHTMGDFRAAWFKDPGGNILHLNSGD